MAAFTAGPLIQPSTIVADATLPVMQDANVSLDVNELLNRLHAEIAERKRLQEALQNRQEELRSERERLEDRVKERTRELVEVTAQLKHEVEQRRRAEDRLRQLSGRLLNLRDEERRRLARELHDSVSQALYTR